MKQKYNTFKRKKLYIINKASNQVCRCSVHILFVLCVICVCAVCVCCVRSVCSNTNFFNFSPFVVYVFQLFFNFSPFGKICNNFVLCVICVCSVCFVCVHCVCSVCSNTIFFQFSPFVVYLAGGSSSIQQLKERLEKDLLEGRNSHTRPLFALPHSRSSLGRSSAPASIDRSSLHRRRPGTDHDQTMTLTSSALQASLASPNTGASPSPISHKRASPSPISHSTNFGSQTCHSIQLQHNSITTVFNYSRIQLHSSALQPTKQGLRAVLETKIIKIMEAWLRIRPWRRSYTHMMKRGSRRFPSLLYSERRTVNEAPRCCDG
ncbi:hypothetical protein LXL04_023603 [Taraxacum kok-saghyz]